MESITEVKSDYYLMDATGHVVALRTKVTPTGLGTTTSWEYYVYGSEREARLVNLDSDPKFDDAEVSFYLTDHLGNTRISYTPVLTDVPDVTTNVFDSDFALGTEGWVGGGTTTANAVGGNLIVTNHTNNPSCYKSFSVIAGNVYDFEFNITPVTSSTLAVLINGTYLGSFSGADEVQYTASTTGTVQVTFVSAALGEFTVKEATMDETVPAHTTVSYTINNVLDYFPYGKVLREYIAGDKERFLTTQHERDQETGLDNRGARYYDSDVARFLSLDPHASMYEGLSPYSYVGGNPLSIIDPNGKDTIYVFNQWRDENGDLHKEKSHWEYDETSEGVFYRYDNYDGKGKVKSRDFYAKYDDRFYKNNGSKISDYTGWRHVMENRDSYNRDVNAGDAPYASMEGSSDPANVGSDYKATKVLKNIGGAIEIGVQASVEFVVDKFTRLSMPLIGVPPDMINPLDNNVLPSPGSIQID